MMMLRDGLLVVALSWQCGARHEYDRRQSEQPEPEEIIVSRELYLNVTDVAMADARMYWERVDTRCTARVTEAWPAHIQLSSLSSSSDKSVPRLCRVTLDTGETGVVVDSRRMAVMMMVDSVAYLKLPGNWLAFLNKAAYCRATRRRFFLWVGTLPKADLDARHPVPWMRCVEKPGNTLNIHKAIAFLALFASQRNLSRSGVLYLDADAWFSDLAFRQTVHPEEYFLESRAFIYGNQNKFGGPKIPMNGGILAVRDSPSARRFLALWWWSRCGKHDQLPLWATMFATFSAAAPLANFAVDATLFAKYSNAHNEAIRSLAAAAPRLRENLRDDAFDGGNFAKTGVLDRPLNLPGGVLVLPTAPIDRPLLGAAPRLPALRSDVNASAQTLCCHTRARINQGDGQCRGKDVCAHHKCAPFLSDHRARRVLNNDSR
ncbi:hypothetical protein CTAYLR_007885 [Chrysophaeum taylorii]|uniref:Nucleotide-diphospho-sugar transferase domain-containing protein n=1 Tax=Chrysophaeum taylorii TaxID=2483200 RepID=A0AAD7UM12_9STRA|nr:hypothetical protein CTAYLR_007885 [Chrysophaeum taylorii]